MNPGNSQILTCPFCGQKKEIMSLLSGNTCGAELWSDNKQIAPMLPEISYVQKCNTCGKYFIKERQKVVYAKSSISFELGLLTFPEMKEAFEQFAEDKLSRKEEAKIRMMLHHAYNDFYYRDNMKREINENDEKLFHDNALWLINNVLEDAVIKAEFYREIGEFVKANEQLETFSSVKAPNDFLKEIIVNVRKRIDKADRMVFKIY